MKKVLITGANSYIGTNVEQWLLKEPDKYHVETLDMKDPNWINFDFSKFDVVFHVAGIAHIKETKKNRDLYYKINRDLAVETAKKAKISGVKQFIFMSSMSIYGMITGVITKNTQPKPKTYYGKSKYEAELVINQLNDVNFNVSVLRPPMVYGENSPGNYQRLEKIAKYMRFLPKIDNKRSVIEINKLVIEISKLIDNNKSGLYCPDNDEYLMTNQVIREFRKKLNKKTSYSFILTCIFIVLRRTSNTVRKLYGSLYYDHR